MTDQRRQRALQLHIQSSFSSDIQGLRAVAVTLVFAYHLFPSSIPGGFVGVDVFFVISGYLITGLLLKDLESSGRIALLNFYGRRVKRLLPAASAVLVTVGLLHQLLPASTWEQLSQQITASALYYQNWWLGLQSVDYLRSETDPGPLQHFWSLAVEEQYYIVWPLIFFCLSLTFVKSRDRRMLALAWSVAIVFVVSLGHSVLYSSANPEMAYFASTTRAWELALGGLLNFFRPGILLQHFLVARVIGLAMIIASCFLIDASSIFPGFIALLPTVGTGLIIVCSGINTERPLGMFSTRPMQYLGDISYSLYLWHWPVIIFYGGVVGSAGFFDVVIMITLALALADLSKRTLEDPLRRKNFWLEGKWPLVLGILCTGLSLLSAKLVQLAYEEERAAAKASINAAPESALKPDPLEATQDRPALAIMGCHASQEEVTPRVCSFGEEDGAIHLALVGDSHAMQWSPAFRAIAADNGWRFTLFTKSACTYAPILVGIGSPPRPYHECLEWRNQVAAELERMRPSHVIVAQSLAYRVFEESNRVRSTDRLAAAYAQSWLDLQSQGIQVLTIRDTPRMTFDAPQCLTAPGNTPEDCYSRRSAVLAVSNRPDPLLRAAEQAPDVFVMDMSDQICEPAVCPAVKDNLLIWRDRHHLTATFVKSLIPAVARQLSQAIEGKEIRIKDPAQTTMISSQALVAASTDFPAVYEHRCFNRAGQEPLQTCEFGATDSNVSIALIGDSRAAQWSPALIRIAEKHKLRLITVLNASCPMGALQLVDQNCAEWTQAVTAWIDKERPRHLIVSQSRGHRVAGVERGQPNAAALSTAIARWIESIPDLSENAFLIADTPRLAQNPLECLATATSEPLLTCATHKESALPTSVRPDPLEMAAGMSSRVILIDMNHLICPAGGNTCPPMIDGSPVWRTKYLLTAKFAASLSAQLEHKLGIELDGVEP